MKKALLIFCILLFSIHEVKAQIGCGVGNTLYPDRKGGSANYNSTNPQTYGPECSFIPFGGTCNVSGVGGGIFVDTIECPIDESYIFLGMALLISIIAFKKVDLFYTK